MELMPCTLTVSLFHAQSLSIGHRVDHGYSFGHSAGVDLADPG
jgi:hypothetical protein